MAYVTLDLLTASEAGEILSPHRDRIRDCFMNAWKRWTELIEREVELGLVVSNRSRASLVSDFVAYEAQVAFDGQAGVVLSESRGFLLVTIDNRIILRFKKFRGRSLATASVPTQQSRDWALQALPGMEPVTHLVAGYLPDAAAVGLERIAIVCSFDGYNLWVIDLNTTASAQTIPFAQDTDERDTIIRSSEAGRGAETATEEG